MEMSVVLVTPDLARTLLAYNEGNRKLDKRRVARYAAEMHAGKWKLTHQAIAIAPDGRVLDGQHRLEAIIESDCEVPFYLCRDADPDTFGVVDQGKTRTANDIWRIGGKSASGVPSIARLVYLYDHYRTHSDWSNLSTLVTNNEIFEWAQRPALAPINETVADVCLEASKYEMRFRKEVKKVGPAVGATLAVLRAYAGISIQNVWDMAFRPLVDCIGLQPGTAVYAFHKVLHKRTSKSHDSCFSLVLNKGHAMNVARDRLSSLLQYVEDVSDERPRHQYQFSGNLPLPAFEWNGDTLRAY